MKLFNKNSSTRKKAFQAHPVLQSIYSLDKDFKSSYSQQADPEPSQNCCVAFFSCLKKLDDSIPKEYKDIMKWLTTLAAFQSTDGFDQDVLVSALHASLVFVSQDTTGSELPAIVLRELIEKIAGQYNLDLSLDPDYDELRSYCKQYNIDIPQPIERAMNEEKTAQAVTI